MSVNFNKTAPQTIRRLNGVKTTEDYYSPGAFDHTRCVKKFQEKSENNEMQSQHITNITRHRGELFTKTLKGGAQAPCVPLLTLTRLSMVTV